MTEPADARFALWQRLDRVVDFWTPREPSTADYLMCQFFIFYEDLEELTEVVERAERCMEE